MKNRLFKCFSTPTPLDLATRQYWETERELLKAEAHLEDWQTQVEKLQRRVVRLRTLVDNARKEET